MLKYLIDENQRGLLWHVIQKHNTRSMDILDVLRVGDPSDLPLRSTDQAILEWSCTHERILVTFDKRTIPKLFQARLAAGFTHPGVFMLRRDDIVMETLEHLVLAAYASDPAEWVNAIRFIP